MFLPALATVPAAWVLAYVPHFVKLGVVLSKQRQGASRCAVQTDTPVRHARGLS